MRGYPSQENLIMLDLLFLRRPRTFAFVLLNCLLGTTNAALVV